MGRISVGQAIGAGFELIRREPVTFLVWCAGYFLISAVPQALVWPQMAQVYASLGSDADGQALLEAQSRLGVYQPISLVIGLLLYAMLPAAIFRAVLFPDQRRFFYLRLGMREFWTLIVSIVVAIVWLIAFIVIMVPIGLFTLGAAAVGGTAGAVIAVVAMLVGYVFGIGASVWIILRFSLAPVMSFAENTFRVPESWRLTKGHAWRLFLVGLALFAIVIIAELALFGAALAALTSGSNAGQLLTDPAAMTALMQQITLPGMLVASAVFSVFAVAAYVLGGAAWATIYRQLKPPLDDTFA